MLSSLKLSPVDKNASPRPSTRAVRIERFTHREGADQPPEVLLGIYRRDADGTTTVTADGGTRTPDLGGNAGTKDLGAAITAAIK